MSPVLGKTIFDDNYEFKSFDGAVKAAASK